MRKVFITSDTHFNHAKILTFENKAGQLHRPEFKSVKDMNEFIIDKWNSVVGTNDRVYHLGDVYFGKFDRSSENAAILRRLNGEKTLILGNHDDGADPTLHQFFDRILLWKVIKSQSVVLSHAPLPDSVIEEKRFNDRAINIHGHLHRNPDPSCRHINASVEMHNYTPRLIDELLEDKKHS